MVFKVTKKIRKLAVFVLLAAVLVGMVPEREAKAVDFTCSKILTVLGVDIADVDVDSWAYYLVYEYTYASGEMEYMLFLHSVKPVKYGGTSLSNPKLQNSNGTSLGNYAGATYFIRNNTLVYRGSSGGINEKSFYAPVSGTFRVVYANFSTEFMSSIPTCVDYVSDDITELTPTNSPTPTPTPTPVHTHSWTSRTTAATCTTAGRSWEECSCGATRNDTALPALGHSWVTKEDVGSCTVDSKTWEECSVCSATQNEVITPASGHVWVAKEEPATCTDAGRSWEECGCGETQNETELPALGHTWEAKEELGSCTVDSKTWEECSVCSSIQNEVITPASGHVWVVKEEPATCVAAGRSWEECTCGVTQNETEVPALGHSWVAKSQDASCTIDGKTWEECSNCSAVQNETEIAATGHIYDNDEDSVCNVCYYNRNIEKSAFWLDMVPIILTLFYVFPLNVVLGVNLLLLGVVIYRRLKKK